MDILANIMGLLFFIFMIAALVGLIKPAWVKQDSRGKAFVGNLVAAFVFLMIGMAINPNKENGKSPALESPTQNQEQIKPTKFLPLSRGEVLSVYKPIPDKIGSEITSNGTIIDSYMCKYHTLELEAYDGRLVRASVKYNIPEMKMDPKATLSFIFFSVSFTRNIAGVNLGEDLVMDQLGLNNAFEPGPDELTHNGVRLRRYTNGGALIFEAVPE